MSMWTAEFWKAATERAIKTAAQTSILTIGADAVNVITVDWLEVGGFAAGGLVLSYLTSLASGVKDGNPSATNSEVAVGTVGDDLPDGQIHYRGEPRA